MIAHRQHPRANLFEKRGYTVTPIFHPEQGSTTKKRSHTTALRLCTRVLLSAVLACALLIPVTAEEAHASDQPRIVKVGYTDSEGLLAKNDDGTYEGYTYDYLMRVAQFTGWSFEFVEAEGDNANERALRLLEMLDNGEVDIEGSMSYSAALAEMYEYPENSYGSAHTALFAPNIHATVSKTNLFTPKRAARGHPRHREEAPRGARVLLRSERHQPGHRRMLHHARAARQNLDRRSRRVLEIDVNIFDGFHIVSSFAGRPFFFAAPKGERSIIDELDATIDRINQSNPQLQETLYKKHFLPSEDNYDLTSAELRYARNYKTLRVGVLTDRPPLQSFDPETGEFKGVTKGILEYLSKHTGLSFEMVSIPRYDDLATALREENIDIVAGVNDDDNTEIDKIVAMTAPYMTTSILLVYNKFVDPDRLDGKSIALLWDQAETAPEGAPVQLYDTIEECLEAVNSGEVDYTYGTSYTTPYYLNIDELSNILYLPTSTQSIDICFGLAQPVDPDLLVILNKALRSLNSAQLDSIIYDNSLIDQDEQINLFIKDHLGEFALACISLLVLIIVLLALYLRSRMHAARAVREENLRFQELYRLANEQFFEYSIKSDTLRISKSKSLLSSSYVDDATSMDDGSSYVSYENARQLIKHSANPELLDAFTSPSNAVTEVLCHEEANPDKDRKWIRITSHFVEDDAGKPISVIGKIANIDDEMREKMDLSERAHHDGLTGLLNWQTFQETAGELLSNGTAGAVLVVDTDDFKGVNDTYGHLAGDRALQQTAAALTAAFRPQDLIGRLGGDEFAICVNGRIDDERLASACAGIVKRGVTFTDQYGTEHEVTLSIGGVELHGKIASYQSAYRQADKALYRAKAGGKNRFVIGSYQAE